MNPTLSRSFVLKGLSLLLGVILTLVLLLLVELGFRLLSEEARGLAPWLPADRDSAVSRAELLEFHRERAQVHEFDPVLFWRNKPGIDVEWRGVRVQTNSLGLRDDEVPESRAEDEYRILLLGESTAFGDLVAKQRVFAEVLEKALDRRSENCRVSVINAAVTGYSLFQSYKYLEMYGLDLEPDMVMIYHGRNDFFSTAFTSSRTASPLGEAGLSDLEISEERSRFPNNIDLHLYYNSFAYRWIQSRSFVRAGDGTSERRTGGKPRVSESERREILEKIRRLLEEHRTRFVVLIPAYLSFTRHREVLIDFSRRTGVPAVDLELAVASMGRERSQLFFEDQLHPKPILHRAFAGHILRFLWHEENGQGLGSCLDARRSRGGPTE